VRVLKLGGDERSENYSDHTMTSRRQTMTDVYHREYLAHLPLPLAQLCSRAYNAKDPRGQHDNAFYLFEALVNLMAAPLVAAYVALI
jgi:hypothetical protein